MYNIITALDPRLRILSENISIVDEDLKKVLDKLLATMYHDRGVGLAAPQVGINKRFFVLDLGDNDEMVRPEGFYPLFVVNPEILSRSDSLVEGVEGCLSIPGITVKIKRPEFIKVSYLDYHNEKKILELDGWLARAFLHELDHLNGVLAIDYMKPVQKAVALEKMKKFIKKKIKTS